MKRVTDNACLGGLKSFKMIFIERCLILINSGDCWVMRELLWGHLVRMRSHSLIEYARFYELCGIVRLGLKVCQVRQSIICSK